jgi:hypothetical protein
MSCQVTDCTNSALKYYKYCSDHKCSVNHCVNLAVREIEKCNIKLRDELMKISLNNVLYTLTAQVCEHPVGCTRANALEREECFYEIMGDKQNVTFINNDHDTLFVEKEVTIYFIPDNDYRYVGVFYDYMTNDHIRSKAEGFLKISGNDKYVALVAISYDIDVEGCAKIVLKLPYQDIDHANKLISQLYAQCHGYLPFVRQGYDEKGYEIGIYPRVGDTMKNAPIEITNYAYKNMMYCAIAFDGIKLERSLLIKRAN